jgi:hypothetical protein
MIILDTTTKTLEIGLAGSVTTTEPHVTVCYYDTISQTKTDFSEPRRATKLTKTSGVTPVTICDAPTIIGAARCIFYICIHNADNTSATITVRIDDGGTDYRQYSHAVPAGHSLIYDSGNGWVKQ